MKLYQDRDWLEQKYIIEKLSSNKIASLYNYSATSIIRWLKILDIKVRTNSESKKGILHTEEVKKKISESQKGDKNTNWRGKSVTEETRRKKREANLGKRHTEEAKKKMSESKMGDKNPNWGKPPSEETRRKQRETLTGKCRSSETKRRLSKSKKGDKNPSWIGGVSFEPYGLDFNDELRGFIRKRDNFKCQECGAKENGRKHTCHHIDYNKQNNDPINFILLCNPCHGKTQIERECWQEHFMFSRQLKTIST